MEPHTVLPKQCPASPPQHRSCANTIMQAGPLPRLGQVVETAATRDVQPHEILKVAHEAALPGDGRAEQPRGRQGQETLRCRGPGGRTRRQGASGGGGGRRRRRGAFQTRTSRSLRPSWGTAGRRPPPWGPLPRWRRCRRKRPEGKAEWSMGWGSGVLGVATADQCSCRRGNACHQATFRYPLICPH